MLLQAVVGPLSVLGTFLGIAAFLTLTAHLAARNVLGDVSPRRALGVGPVPAVVAVASGALSLPAALTLPAAVLLDWFAIRWRYEVEGRTTTLITVIHFTVSVLIGLVLVAAAVLLSSRPG
ncbi:DUF7473 family protein [Haloparvum sedimenti]|uniref:DUF7473 family protein n=1 Tax=Haloparvum sedimenti TaxID=1678448 RepID=UPI00071E9C18|nr:hypothetical protein [Haloparvum sedimenti]